MAKFEFLRLSLSVPPLAALDNSGQQEPKESRQDFLTAIFSARQDFFHRGTLFSYVPIKAAGLRPGALAGFIGKQTSEMENAGPDQMFALAPRKKWKAAFLVIDTNPREQIIAIEKRLDIGSSHAVVENFIENAARSQRRFTWHTDVEYITSKRAFEIAAEEYRGQITELSFTFYPANGLRGFDKFKEFDRLAKQQTNSEKSIYSLKNDQGNVEPSGDFVESAVEYANEGAGRTRMKAGRKVVYDSRQSKKTKIVPEQLMPREGEPIKVAGAANLLLTGGKAVGEADD